MRAAAEHRWGTPDAGRAPGRHRRRRQGRPLARPGTWSTTAPRSWSPTSNRAALIAASATTYPQVDVVADTAALIAADIDVYAPCALGGALNDDTVPALRATVVAGGANNQLAHPGIEKLLEDRGILYAPDYVVNSGGVIQVADEIDGFDFDRAKARADEDLRHHPADPRSWRRPRASRRPWPRTGWPSGGWPRSAACAPSACPDHGSDRGVRRPRWAAGCQRAMLTGPCLTATARKRTATRPTGARCRTRPRPCTV